jgi:hypothetical protein
MDKIDIIDIVDMTYLSQKQLQQLNLKNNLIDIKNDNIYKK